LRLFYLRHRRLLAATAGAAAVLAGLHANTPPAEAVETVWVVAADLPAGHTLAASDLARAVLPVGSAPDGAVPDATALAGRTLAGAVRRGEVLTDTRILGPGLLTALPADLVAITVRAVDSGTGGFVRPGDRVDVLAGPDESWQAPGGGPGEVLATAALVLAVPPVGDDGGYGAGGAGADTGGVLLVAVRPQTARALAGAAGRRALSVALRSGSQRSVAVGDE
jgi:Flp pilus assembly protein CpaB